jgi:uncharacterized tellurite resistance protein B-like protein
MNMESQIQLDGSQLILSSEGNSDSYDARLLISTLLVFVAKSDGGISEMESSRMIELLSSRLNIKNNEALASLSSAIMSLSDDAGIVATLQKISQGLAERERREIFSMTIEVMAADEKLDPGELVAIKFAGQILGLSQNEIHSTLRSSSALIKQA